MFKYKISPIDEVDIPQAQTFMLAIIKNDFGYDYNPDWHWDITKLNDTYLANSDSTFFVAKSNKGKIIGSIAARQYDKDFPELKNKYNKTNTLGIWRHYIDIEFRNQGIGTALLAKVENFAKNKGFKYLYLHTQKTILGSLEYWLAKKYVITHELGDALQTVHLEKKL